MGKDMKTTDVKEKFDSTPRSKPITTVVLHATAGASARSSFPTLLEKGASYHYVIERDGTILKLVPVMDEAAHHAGQSYGPNGPNVNGYSIGIAFANLNDGKEKVTEAQLAAALSLIRTWQGTLPTLKWLCTHHHVAPSRKSDPRGVDTRVLASQLKGIKPWKQPTAKQVT